MPNLKRLKDSHQIMFRRIRGDIALLKGGSSVEIRKYENKFKNSFKKEYFKISKNEFSKRIRSAKIILIGDFHTFRQSQKAFLRILYEEKRIGGNFAIGLECILYQQEKYIENYLLGHISIDELFEDLSLQTFWPFSLESYRDIFLFARKHKIQILGLNTKGKEASSLLKRDVFCAKRIRDSFLLKQKKNNQTPHEKLFVLYGELHLSDSMLPRLIQKALNWKKESVLVIHQNIPRLYWRYFNAIYKEKSEIFSSGGHEICIFNSTPWMKIKSYLDWIESGETDDSIESDLVDPTDSILQFYNYLGKIFGFKKRDTEEFRVIGPEQIEDQIKILRSQERKTFEYELAKYSKLFKRTVYLPEKRMFLTPTLSQNTISECASLLLFFSREKNRMAGLLEDQDIIHLINQFFVGFLGSKILNPKRKCNEIEDMLHFIDHSSKTKHSKIYESKKRLFDRVFLIFKDKALSEKKLNSKYTIGLNGFEKIELARLTGFLLANRLFYHVVEDRENVRFLKNIFLAGPLNTKETVIALNAVMEKTRNTSGPGLAKKDTY